MKEVRLDLFKLHDENDQGHAIKVILNTKLEKLLRNMIDEIKEKTRLSPNYFSNLLGISLSMYYQDLQHSRFRLYAIKNLIMLWANTLSKSHLLFKDLKSILRKFDLTPDVQTKSPLFQIFIWKKDKLKRFNQLFFERDSIKHRKLKLHLGEYELNGDSLSDVETELDYLFPERTNVVRFNTVIKLLKPNKVMSGKNIQIRLNRDRRNVSEILNKLNKWNILKFEKQKDNQKFWSINPDLNLRR